MPQSRVTAAAPALRFSGLLCLLWHPQMQQNRFLHRQHFRLGQGSDQAFEAGFVCCHDLIRHGFGWFPGKRHQCLARILAAGVAGYRYHHNPRKTAVCGVIADNYCRLCCFVRRWVVAIQRGGKQITRTFRPRWRAAAVHAISVKFIYLRPPMRRTHVLMRCLVDKWLEMLCRAGVSCFGNF